MLIGGLSKHAHKWATDLAMIRLFARVNPPVLLEVLRVHEGGVAGGALVGPFAGVGGLHVVVQQAAPLERLGAFRALVPFVVVVSSPLMRLQVAALTEKQNTFFFTEITFYTCIPPPVSKPDGETAEQGPRHYLTSLKLRSPILSATKLDATYFSGHFC